LPNDIEGAVKVLELHPMFNPAAYVAAEFGPGVVNVHRSPAHEDGAWISLVGTADVRPLQAIVAAVNPHLDIELVGKQDDWTAQIVERDQPAKEFSEVTIAKVSGGSTFVFQPLVSDVRLPGRI
jgi:hypothetical protein